jgi:dTDP-4-dehydrorhamnose reductase
VDTILVAGVDSLVGTNLAAVLAKQHRVVGLAADTPVSIFNCEIEYCSEYDRELVRRSIAASGANRIVYCGAAAQSTWDPAAANANHETDAAAIRIWAQAADEFDCHFTAISSDAVFSGPWMFHAESCRSLCPSTTARSIRGVERAARELCPQTLVIRTNAFGWAHPAVERGWIETVLLALETGEAISFDHTRHATPILATDLAEIVQQALAANLTGVYHVAGAERVNPLQFATLLAREFGLPEPASASAGSLTELPTGFGRGETSLNCSSIRKCLGVTMPVIADGIGRLARQQRDGYCDRLCAECAELHEMVA